MLRIGNKEVLTILKTLYWYILELLVKPDISCVLHVSFKYFVLIFVDKMSADSV